MLRKSARLKYKGTSHTYQSRFSQRKNPFVENSTRHMGFFFTPGKCAGTHKTLALGAYAAADFYMNWVGTASLDEHRSDRSWTVVHNGGYHPVMHRVLCMFVRYTYIYIYNIYIWTIWMYQIQLWTRIAHPRWTLFCAALTKVLTSPSMPVLQSCWGQTCRRKQMQRKPHPGFKVKGRR